MKKALFTSLGLFFFLGIATVFAQGDDYVMSGKFNTERGEVIYRWSGPTTKAEITNQGTKLLYDVLFIDNDERYRVFWYNYILDFTWNPHFDQYAATIEKVEPIYSQSFNTPPLSGSFDINNKKMKYSWDGPSELVEISENGQQTYGYKVYYYGHDELYRVVSSDYILQFTWNPPYNQYYAVGGKITVISSTSNPSLDYPNLVVVDIKFVKEWKSHKNVLLAHICNKGSVGAKTDDLRTNFTLNNMVTIHSWGGFYLEAGACTNDNFNSLPFTLVSQYNVTKSGNYEITAEVDTSWKISESNEKDNSLKKSVYIDLGELPRISDLKVVGNELQWTAPKIQAKQYMITFYTGEAPSNANDNSFGGCSWDMYQSENPGGSSYCVGKAKEITFQSGHLEKLTLSQSPVVTFIVRYKDSNGALSSGSNRVVYRTEIIQELPRISDLKVVGSQLQWTVPKSGIKQYFITFYTGETQDSSEKFGGCSYDSYQDNNPGGVNYCTGYANGINFQQGHLEKLSLNSLPVKTFKVRYKDNYDYISDTSNLAVYREIDVPNLIVNDMIYRSEWKGKKNVVMAQICNIGGGPVDHYMYTQFSYNNKEVQNNMGNFYLAGNACTKWDGDNTPFVELKTLGIYQSGTYPISVLVDKGRNIMESNEKDNSKIANQNVVIPVIIPEEEKPDLYVKEVTFQQEWEGLENEFVALICNAGFSNIGTKETFTTNFTANNRKSIFQWGNGFTLKVGECKEAAASAYVLGITTNGKHAVGVYPDYSNIIEEIDENNYQEFTVYVDLIEEDSPIDLCDSTVECLSPPNDLHVENYNGQTILEWTNSGSYASHFARAVYTGEIGTNEFKKIMKIRDESLPINDTYKSFNVRSQSPIMVGIKVKKWNYDRQSYDISDWSNIYTWYPTGYTSTVQVPPAGFEDEVITAYTSYTNPFPDTNIQNLEGIAAAELYRRAVIGGFPDGKFKGYRPVNRAEIAKFLLLTRYAQVGDIKNNGRFPDVLDNQWYTRFVIQASKLGIISGYPNGLFRPEKQVNTVEFLKMLTLTFGLEENLPFTYTDIPQNSWYRPYVGIAQKYNLFPKRNQGTLLPEKELTRYEIAVALYQYLKNRYN